MHSYHDAFDLFEAELVVTTVLEVWYTHSRGFCCATSISAAVLSTPRNRTAAITHIAAIRFRAYDQLQWQFGASQRTSAAGGHRPQRVEIANSRLECDSPVRRMNRTSVNFE
jgi:hypothetical protein